MSIQKRLLSLTGKRLLPSTPKKEELNMKKQLTFLLLLLTLIVPVSAQAPTVALTFDDGPSGRFTAALLDGLQKREVKATFFLCGYRIRQYPELTERIAAEGHEIGCHGFSHNSMEGMSRRDIAEEIAATLELLPQGTKARFLRPPGGCCSSSVSQVAKAKQMPILQWSVDPRDWAIHDAAVVKGRVVRAVKDGDIILMHDMSTSSVSAALAIVDELTARGFRFTTVSRLAAGCTLRPGEIYGSFPQKSEPAQTGSQED